MRVAIQLCEDLKLEDVEASHPLASEGSMQLLSCAVVPFQPKLYP